MAEDNTSNYPTEHSRPHSDTRLRLFSGSQPRNERAVTWAIVATLSGLILTWLLLILEVGPVRFLIAGSTTRTNLETLLAGGMLFALLVLLLAPLGATAVRMRWVASGFFIIGMSYVLLGGSNTSAQESLPLNEVLYGSLYARTCGVFLIAVGLVARTVPSLKRRQVVLLALGFVIVGTVIVAQSNRLMPLLDINRIFSEAAQTAPGGTSELSELETDELRQVILDAQSTFPGLTGWYFVLSSIPVALGIVAVWGATKRAEGLVGNWLVIAAVLLTGAQLFSVFWPPHISPFLTASSVLRLGVALAVIVGGIYYFRQIIDERAAMLRAEQDRVRQLQELSRLNADFSHMVAHEIASPLGAIARMSEIIALGSLSSDEAATIAKRIQSEARLLQLLVADVRGTAEVEREDFEVRLQAVSVDSLLDEAEAYVRARDGTHPFHVERLHGDRSPDIKVLADPLRIGQVLRNLIGNALRHTAPGTPISLCTSLSDGRVEFVVTDQGPGIAADDQVRIFEKFGRGTKSVERNIRGHGLGLYLSRRIVLAHGSDLRLDSVPGEYSRFWFTLEVAE